MTENLMPRTTHVVRRGAIYYFRMRVPADLVAHYGKKEITFSLKTKDQAEAKRKGLAEATRHLDDFEKLLHAAKRDRIEVLSPEEILRITQDFSYEVLAEDEAERKSGSVSKNHLLALEVLEDHARPTLAGDGAYDDGDSRRWMTKLVRNYVEGLNLDVAPNSDAEDELIYAFSEASVRVVEATKERGKGKVVPTPERPSAAIPNNPNRPSNVKQVYLSTVIESYSIEQEKAGNWNEKTELDNRAVFTTLLAVTGDVIISELSFFHALKFKETLLRLPANLNKSPRYRGKTIDQILEMSDVKPLSITTVNKYITRLSSLLGWATKHGYVKQNFAEGMLITQRGKKASDARKMFNMDHLNAIFQAIAERRVTASGNLASFHYWAPLLGYLTGARVNEIASLRVIDFGIEADIPFISVTQQNDGETTKTDASRRDVPLHPVLIRLGLLKHVKGLKDEGQERLFPELSRVKHKGYGAKVTSWFSGHDSKVDGFLWRDAGIKEDKLSFHSYRHTMTTLLERAEIRDVLIKRILGHSLQGDVTFGRYSKGSGLEPMLKAITTAVPEAPLGELFEFEKWLKGDLNA